MYLETDDLPFCCAVRLIGELPYDEDFRRDSDDYQVTAQEVKSEVQRRIDYARESNISIVLCTVNSDQKKVAEVLVEMGFVESSWATRPRAESPRHSSKVKILYKFLRTTRSKKHGTTA